MRNKHTIKMTNNVQEAREQSFERIINDAVKARQRNFNVTMRDKYLPGDEVPAIKKRK